MCGIVGFLSTSKGQSYKAKSDWMKASLVADTLRGHHSTGVFNVPFDNKREGGIADWCKQIAPGPIFVQNEEFMKRNRLAEQQRYFVGHNRFATMGKTDDVDNAHPFQEGNVTLVHNGTLTSDYKLPHKGKYEVDVDSHAICHNLAIAEVSDAKEVLESLYGSFTLVWHDARDNSLNIARNRQRPLAMMQGADGTVYFCSEDGMLKWIAGRVGIRVSPIYSPKVGVHLKWLPDELVPQIDPFTLFTWSGNWNYGGAHGHHSGGYAGWSRGFNYDDEIGAQVGAPNPSSKSVTTADPHLPKVEDPSELQSVEIRKARHSPYAEYAFWPYDLQKYEARKLRRHAKTRSDIGVVNGMIGDQSAVILGGISAAKFASHWPKKDPDDCWTVRVVGVKWTNCPKDNTPYAVLVCKVVDWEFIEWVDGDLDDDIPFGKAEDDPLAQEELLLGPGGEYMPQHEWLEWTKKGCLSCGLEMVPMDAAETEWTVDGEPICPDCVQDFKENNSYAN